MLSASALRHDPNFDRITPALPCFFGQAKDLPLQMGGHTGQPASVLLRFSSFALFYDGAYKANPYILSKVKHYNILKIKDNFNHTDKYSYKNG